MSFQLHVDTVVNHRHNGNSDPQAMMTMSNCNGDDAKDVTVTLEIPIGRKTRWPPQCPTRYLLRKFLQLCGWDFREEMRECLDGTSSWARTPPDEEIYVDCDLDPLGGATCAETLEELDNADAWDEADLDGPYIRPPFPFAYYTLSMVEYKSSREHPGGSAHALWVSADPYADLGNGAVYELEFTDVPEILHVVENPRGGGYLYKIKMESVNQITEDPK